MHTRHGTYGIDGERVNPCSILMHTHLGIGHDERIEEVKQLSDNEYIVSGKANLEKILDMFDISEEPDVLTVNGWAMKELGRIPQENDIFESYGLNVKVLKMNGRRVENLHITDNREDESEEDTSEDGKND